MEDRLPWENTNAPLNTLIATNIGVRINPNVIDIRTSSDMAIFSACGPAQRIRDEFSGAEIALL